MEVQANKVTDSLFYIKAHKYTQAEEKAELLSWQQWLQIPKWDYTCEYEFKIAAKCQF